MQNMNRTCMLESRKKENRAAAVESFDLPSTAAAVGVLQYNGLCAVRERCFVACEKALALGPARVNASNPFSLNTKTPKYRNPTPLALHLCNSLDLTDLLQIEQLL